MKLDESHGLISAHPHPGSISSYGRPRTLQWNDIGQFVFPTAKEIAIVTPHIPLPNFTAPPPPLTSNVLSDATSAPPTLPPPHNALPLHFNRFPVLTEQDISIPGSMARSINRKDLEIEGLRDGNGFMGPKDERDVGARQLSWSPMGLCASENENETTTGCLMAVLDTWMNLSVRATRKDHIQGQIEVIADISSQIFSLSLPPPTTIPQPKQSGKQSGSKSRPIAIKEIDEIDELNEIEEEEEKEEEEGEGTPEPNVPVKKRKKTAVPGKLDSSLEADRVRKRALEMQITTIAWSSAPSFKAPYGARPHESLLAVGSRGGDLSLWEYQTSGKMERVWTGNVSEDWVSELVWNEWVDVDDDTRAIDLTFSKNDGSIHSLKITRSLVVDEDQTHVTLSVSKEEMLNKGDGRPLSGIQWLNGVLCWAKAETGHVRLPDTKACYQFPLRKIGKWAGCTSHGQVVGIGALSSNRILFSMYSAEQHVLNLGSSGKKPSYDFLASQNLTKAVRNAQKDADVAGIVSSVDMSMRVIGSELMPNEMCKGSALLAMIYEPINLHDLSIAREAKREHWTVIIDLTEALASVPTPLSNEPLTSERSSKDHRRVASTYLLPFLPGLIARNSVATEIQDNPYYTKYETMSLSMENASQKRLFKNISFSLFEMEGVMQRSLSAKWELMCKVQAEPQPFPYGLAVESPQNAVNEHVQYCILLYIVQTIRAGQSVSDSTSALISRYLFVIKSKKHLPQPFQELLPILSPFSIGGLDEACLICRESLPFTAMDGTMDRMITCSKHHKWGRCAITYKLIDVPQVRTCSGCSRKALLPKPHVTANSNEDRVQEDLLRVMERCAWCDGLWRQLL